MDAVRDWARNPPPPLGWNNAKLLDGKMDIIWMILLLWMEFMENVITTDEILLNVN